ncbi:MAG: hypothetical protein A2516_03775, partial [Alphaproteobacteria bacterium RIFOXYD12_FULL_60_8]
MSVIEKGLIEVDPVVVAGWLASGEALAVDVREEAEWEVERIDGAILSPMSDFEPELFPKAGGKRLVLICAKGKRSAAVGQKLLENGVSIAYNMTGGVQ